MIGYEHNNRPSELKLSFFSSDTSLESHQHAQVIFSGSVATCLECSAKGYHNLVYLKIYSLINVAYVDKHRFIEENNAYSMEIFLSSKTSLVSLIKCFTRSTQGVRIVYVIYSKEHIINWHTS